MGASLFVFSTLFAVTALQARSVSPACPKTGPEWKQWRDQQAAYAENPYYKSQFAKTALNFLERCRAQQPTNGCLEPIQRFLNSAQFGNEAPHSLGFKVTDQEYVHETKAITELPALLLSPEFLKWTSNPRQLHFAVEAIQKENRTRQPDDQWIAFSFSSRFLKSFDSARTHGRFLVFIPGNPARAVLYSIRERKEPKTAHPATAIAIIGARTQADGTVQYAFDEYFKVFQKNSPIGLSAPLKTNRAHLDRCIDCHKSGFMPVFATLVSSAKASEQFNTIASSLTPPDFLSQYDIGAYGPPIGPVQPPPRRTTKFLESCLASAKAPVNQNSVNRLAQGMKCAQCHSSDGYGVLNYPALLSEQKIKIASDFIRAGLMPPQLGKKLSQAEREALVTCLRKEYYGPEGLFRSWIAAKSCGGTTQ